jgi:hypothetical protein
MSAPPWIGASVTPQEPWPEERPHGHAPPPDGRFDRRPSTPAPAEGDGARASPAPKASLFEGDVDMIELRRRLSIDPECVPEPPSREQRRSAIRSSPVARSSLYVGAATIVACGVIGLMVSRGQSPIPSNPSSAIVSAMTTEQTTGQGGAQPMVPALLVLGERQSFMNEPLALGAVLLEGTGGEAIHVTGLAAGTRLSVGTPLGANGWRIPARDLAGVLIHPPSSFVGVMRAAIQLRSAADTLLETQPARFEWVARPADGRTPGRPELDRTARPVAPVAGKQDAQRQDAQRTSWFVNRGQELFNNGDFAAARLVLRPAAEAGDAQAALMLGATFDPVIVAELGALGLAPDPSAARAWYQRAMDAGSTEASRRIERLARASK